MFSFLCRREFCPFWMFFLSFLFLFFFFLFFFSFLVSVVQSVVPFPPPLRLSSAGIRLSRSYIP